MTDTPSSSTQAGLMARGAFVALGVVSGLQAFRIDYFTPAQQTHLGIFIGVIFVCLWPFYEIARSAVLAHIKQMADTMNSHGIVVPPPADQEVKK